MHWEGKKIPLMNFGKVLPVTWKASFDFLTALFNYHYFKVKNNSKKILRIGRCVQTSQLIRSIILLTCLLPYYRMNHAVSSQEVQHNCQLHRISFCADDKTDKRIFTFICKDSESNKHLCYVFDSEKCVRWYTLIVHYCDGVADIYQAMLRFLSCLAVFELI